MSIVKFSEYGDTAGVRMIQIGGAHYPRNIAREIANEVLNLLDDLDPICDGCGDPKSKHFGETLLCNNVEYAGGQRFYRNTKF